MKNKIILGLLGLFIIFMLIMIVLVGTSCSSYKGNYSQEAYKYNKKYSKQHKTK